METVKYGDHVTVHPSKLEPDKEASEREIWFLLGQTASELTRRVKGRYAGTEQYKRESESQPGAFEYGFIMSFMVGK